MKNLLKKIKAKLHLREMSSLSVENRFSRIYEKSLWFKNKQSKSGSGSTIEATKNLRYKLPNFLKEIEANSLVDLGCGDFYWMKEINLPCKYIGLDIVKGVVDENIEKYGREHIEFHYHDAIEDDIVYDADVILCREVLFHLSFEHGLQVIKKILDTNARYLLATTCDIPENDKDIMTGQFRNINLQKSPYNLPDCVDKWKDSESVTQDRYMGVWKMSDIKQRWDSKKID